MVSRKDLIETVLFLEFSIIRKLEIRKLIRIWVKYLNGHLTKEDIRTVSKHMKRCAKSLVIKERQIKNTIRNHYIPVRMVKIRIVNTKCW